MSDVYSVYSVNQNKFRVSKFACIIALTNKKLRFFWGVLIPDVLLKYGFCKKYFDRNEPLTS